MEKFFKRFINSNNHLLCRIRGYHLKKVLHYIRSDTSKTIIKRKYQKVMEFYADYSSLLITLFKALSIAFYFVNRFYANHSLSKQIFFFKEAENIHFDINRKSNQIKNLIKLLDPLMEKKNIPLNINENKSQSPKVNEDLDINDLEEGINIYNMSKNIINKECLRKIDRIYSPNDDRRFYDNKMRNKLERKIKFLKDDDYEKNNQNINSIQNSKRNIINRYKIKPVKISSISFKSTKEIELEKMRKISFKYNIFEIFCSYLGPCCMTNKLKTKKNLTKKSNNLLNDKLDISLYIKNTILIDILNQAFINNNMKSMIKFISRPIISLNKNNEKNMSQFYENYELEDFDNLYEDTSNISKKPRLTQAEQKIISFVYNELKEMV